MSEIWQSTKLWLGALHPKSTLCFTFCFGPASTDRVLRFPADNRRLTALEKTGYVMLSVQHRESDPTAGNEIQMAALVKKNAKVVSTMVPRHALAISLSNSFVPYGRICSGAGPIPKSAGFLNGGNGKCKPRITATAPRSVEYPYLGSKGAQGHQEPCHVKAQCRDRWTGLDARIMVDTRDSPEPYQWNRRCTEASGAVREGVESGAGLYGRPLMNADYLLTSRRYSLWQQLNYMDVWRLFLSRGPTRFTVAKNSWGSWDAGIPGRPLLNPEERLVPDLGGRW
ncbi:hypothetical protein QBC41DRAFT_372788 [Cercophora samala]|uniref:Uncharacterized protein n=1 Tax=Cercophora samala TaxID=330535 RepID=A0AA40DCI8_9PEZI|nr:hypothetical protein QBC41DRAFT_372788 [Cercophora samala]